MSNACCVMHFLRGWFMSLLANSSALPDEHNTVNGFIVVRGADKFIAFLCDVFEASENKKVRTPDRDGLLIHAEVRIGNATIMTADAKDDWPIITALTQVYVNDAQSVLDRVLMHGGRVVTRVSPFWNGLHIARFADPWNNLWWLFQPGDAATTAPVTNTTWHNEKPSYVYTSLMEEMAARQKNK